MNNFRISNYQQLTIATTALIRVRATCSQEIHAHKNQTVKFDIQIFKNSKINNFFHLVKWWHLICFWFLYLSRILVGRCFALALSVSFSFDRLCSPLVEQEMNSLLFKVPNATGYAGLLGRADRQSQRHTASRGQSQPQPVIPRVFTHTHTHILYIYIYRRSRRLRSLIGYS